MQSHVLQLAEVMRARGHVVSVLAPSSPQVCLPDYVVSGGRAVPIPYNGSVARLRFGPATHRRVKRWLAEGPSTSCICTSRTRPACRCWR
ncbi:GDP-mannose-dependent alpha-(1-2)-phosphatidylinositol mannosyltransferase domain protein [Mycobacterium xenopi 4042]|uniref:GDP-mannose-dependent alpha-(1-2)-phosphatidylinositol mannosyltransferase domain protein n=1 Tax=Mycobacterium xenopi 4042 TaxID=1299334 RepID=X8CHQ5_MYCXE|nr:GDP-mannose-dependent alpha-(1-2)-phosphatidylinositol mannosyltransferase domain protein [Mycobacterium xenopi 3993]EUA54795.1 GDP-mannose-dependent alpha-(1-2)-phosphatidylinositol mannosyltransferase domain protein [Mycobacterium xenopi 4042]